METDGLLAGVSPWAWLALAIALAGLEMLTVATVFIWSATAAGAVAVLLWLAPGLSFAVQVAVFAVLSIAFTFAGRALVERLGDGNAPGNTLNQRAANLVGREAVVESFAVHEGQVTVDGVPWPARLDTGADPPAPGDRVRVTATDGIVLRVRPLRGEA